MKSEPDVFSIDDLADAAESLWEGVRNYQARNFMQKDMRPGDPVLFYHSNAKPSGVAGLAQVAGEAVADPTQFRRASDYFEPRATRAKPVWFCVPVGFVEKFSLVSLEDLRGVRALSGMGLLRPGQRLSVMPLTRDEFEIICRLGRHRGLRPR